MSKKQTVEDSPSKTMISPVNKNVQYKSITEDQDESSALVSSPPSYKSGVQYKVYRWRWFMLVVMCFLNISNGMVRVCVCDMELFN